jgi:hypothetical protein
MGTLTHRIAEWRRERKRRAAERKLATDALTREAERHPDRVPPSLGPGKPSKRT